MTTETAAVVFGTATANVAMDETYGRSGSTIGVHYFITRKHVSLTVEQMAGQLEAYALNLADSYPIIELSPTKVQVNSKAMRVNQAYFVGGSIYIKKPNGSVDMFDVVDTEDAEVERG